MLILINVDIMVMVTNLIDVRLQFSTSGGSWGKNVVIFGVDNCSSSDVYDKKTYLSSW